MDATRANFDAAAAATRAAMARFGATAPADGADASKAFYGAFRDFAQHCAAAHLRRVAAREKAAKDAAKAALKKAQAAKRAAKGGAAAAPQPPAPGDLQADLKNALKAPRSGRRRRGGGSAARTRARASTARVASQAPEGAALAQEAGAGDRLPQRAPQELADAPVRARRAAAAEGQHPRRVREAAGMLRRGHRQGE